MKVGESCISACVYVYVFEIERERDRVKERGLEREKSVCKREGHKKVFSKSESVDRKEEFLKMLLGGRRKQTCISFKAGVSNMRSTIILNFCIFMKYSETRL